MFPEVQVYQLEFDIFACVFSIGCPEAVIHTKTQPQTSDTLEEYMLHKANSYRTGLFLHGGRNQLPEGWRTYTG